MSEAALTAKEWGEIEKAANGEYNQAPMVFGIVQCLIANAAALPQVNRPHAIAALALINQPFGFTREDVGVVRSAATTIEGDYRVWKEGREEDRAFVGKLRGIADRIEALLPPEA